jgi:capsular exopolysaccharide synthesis family protein
LELRDYINILYARRWIVAGTLAIILATTLVVTLLQAATYQSDVMILAEVNSASESVLGNLLASGMTDTDRFIQNQAKIIKTDTLAQAVESRLRYDYEKLARDKGTAKNAYIPKSIPTVTQLKGMVAVQPGQKTGVFDIVVQGGDPLLTRDVARTYSDVYVANRQLANIKQISEARKEVWNRILEVEEQIQKVANEIKQYKAGEVPTELQAEALKASDLWATLYEKYMTLRISESLEQRGLEIIEPARLGGKVGPKPLRNGILGLFLGLILGVGLAFTVDYLDDVLHSREDFERYYDTSVVGEIPLMPEGVLTEYGIAYFDKPKHQAVEGYRTLRTNLQFLNLKGECSVILFTSALLEEGKSTILVNLGAALSEMGKKVLLVDGDLRKPVLNKYFDVGSREGITGVLAGTCTLEEAIFPSGYDNLYVLPAGVRPPNPGELVASEGMRDILDKVKESADYVLVDAPPALAASDAIAMAPMVDGVLILARAGVAERDSARRVVELLRKVEANILGLVINCIEMGKRYSYYQYYYYEAAPEGQAPGGKSRKKRKMSKKP